jgi:dolichol kinase
MSPAWLPPLGTPAGEIVRAIALLAAYASIIGVAELWRERAHPPAEWTRKLIHAGTGVVSAALPWVIARLETLLVVGAIAGATLFVARRTGRLRSLFGVERKSLGEIYYPLAVIVLFALARQRPVFYLISILSLVVCDALAAVLGEGYGRHKFLVTRDRKSLEGTAAFLFSAFLCVHLPLLLLADLERAVCVLVALQLGLLVSEFEAISTRGTDNLIVPLGTYYLLVKMTTSPAGELLFEVSVLLGILAAVLALSWRSRFLTFSGAIAAHLMLYGCFALGGPRWVVAPALALAGFLLLDHGRGQQLGLPRGEYHVLVVFSASIGSVLWLFADNTFRTLIPGPTGLASGHPFYELFVGALAAALSATALHFLDFAPRSARIPGVGRAALAIGFGYLLVVPASLAAQRQSLHIRGLVVTLLVCAGAVLFYRLVRMRRAASVDILDELRVLALGVILASIAVLPLHLAWLGVAGWSLR